MLCDSFIIASESRKQPGTGRLCIRHGLQSREGLRRNNEKSLRRIKITQRLGDIGAIDIRYEPERHRTLTVMLEGLVRHDRTQVGATNPYVDDIANSPAGMATPFPSPYAIREIRHLF